jgi:uncharacterized protein (TIGR02757 family)
MLSSEEITRLKSHFDECVALYNTPDFIMNDPVSIPHRFTRKQDIEIAGFFAAVFAWGQRVTIINKANHLLHLMDNDPYDFIINHSEKDVRSLQGFVHRTFNDTDLLYFIYKLRLHYQQFSSLEDAFLLFDMGSNFDMAESLTQFHYYFTDDPHCISRTKKHIANPAKGATCKRILMFLRWMVRKDNCGVDFGIWSRIPVASLMIPYDLHVDRVVRRYQLIQRKQNDWKTVEELTGFCRLLDATDPARYDYALFGLSINESLSD